jgi:two-component system CheB/CheR fusion protein
MHASQSLLGASFESTVALAPNALQADLREPPGGSSQAFNESPAALWRQAVHDLRGLLSVVSAVTTTLQRPSSSERREALLAVLQRNVGGMCTLLNGVADLARLDATQEQAVLRPLDLSLVLGGLGGGFRELASCRGIQLELRGPRQLVAESDALMVTRMVQNLMLNAISYTQAGGVALTWGACDDTPAGGLWYFEIADLPRIAANIHDPQTPVAPSPAAAWAPGAGEGIGLCIVRRLCGALGGRMQIVCKGTVRSTRIELPRHYAGSLEELTISATEPGHSRSGVARTTDPAIADNPRRAS